MKTIHLSSNLIVDFVVLTFALLATYKNALLRFINQKTHELKIVI